MNAFHLHITDIFESLGGFGFQDFGGFSNFSRSHGKGRPGRPHTTMEFEDIPSTSSRRQDPPIQHELVVSLQELLTGTKKKMKVSRRILNSDGYTTTVQDKVLEIDVKKGWKEGTKITFPKEGHQSHNKVPADIVFILRDKPHPNFTRDKNNNLLYTSKMSLRSALTGTHLLVPTLDGRTISVNVSEVVNPKTTRVIKEEGLPLPKTPGRRGDLVISFDIVFPDQLPAENKELLMAALPE